MSGSAAPPLVSIVTINLNDREGLRRTLDSIAAQGCADFELVVIDGGSTDGSRDLMSDRAALIRRWVSEPDRGIYDAMNKGVDLARGEWVLFLNAGDAFADARVLDDLSGVLAQDGAEILCGDCLIRYGDGVRRLWRAGPPERLRFGMAFAHPAAFVRRRLLQRHRFDIAGQAGDYAFFLQCHLEGCRFRRIGRTVALFAAGGVSDRRRVRSTLERWRLLRRHGQATAGLGLYYAAALVRAALVPPAKRLLPAPVRQRLIARPRRLIS